MGRKKNQKISEQFALNWLSYAPTLDWYYYRLNYCINVLVLASITTYFALSLNMADKVFTFIISGKVMGTDYVLNFNDICWLSSAIVTSLLAKSIYNYLKIAKNRNKIRVQITEAYPTSLKIRVVA